MSAVTGESHGSTKGSKLPREQEQARWGQESHGCGYLHMCHETVLTVTVAAADADVIVPAGWGSTGGCAWAECDVAAEDDGGGSADDGEPEDDGSWDDAAEGGVPCDAAVVRVQHDAG